jgi:hypothetical protein
VRLALNIGGIIRSKQAVLLQRYNSIIQISHRGRLHDKETNLKCLMKTAHLEILAAKATPKRAFIKITIMLLIMKLI